MEELPFCYQRRSRHDSEPQRDTTIIQQHWVDQGVGLLSFPPHFFLFPSVSPHLSPSLAPVSPSASLIPPSSPSQSKHCLALSIVKGSSLFSMHRFGESLRACRSSRDYSAFTPRFGVASASGVNPALERQLVQRRRNWKSALPLPLLAHLNTQSGSSQMQPVTDVRLGLIRAGLRREGETVTVTTAGNDGQTG
ncbi:unnamed protein product [Pleuronectes platessa]|uniref:Uncharacterized protein n=1 Tax=Pleuronectes platessa TaxID=8262 RepID=A0A9N7VCJ8_PLEPL|nr:unnamed protein product [Pleuronectes platessa]